MYFEYVAQARYNNAEFLTKEFLEDFIVFQ